MMMMMIMMMMNTVICYSRYGFWRGLSYILTLDGSQKIKKSKEHRYTYVYRCSKKKKKKKKTSSFLAIINSYVFVVELFLQKKFRIVPLDV